MPEVSSFASRGDAPHRLQACSARRLLVIGGILLIVAGMIFGDIFAVFVLHQNANRIGERFTAAAGAVVAHQPETAKEAFGAIGGRLENRGTKVDAHAHVIAFGYLALLLALLQPWVALGEQRRKQLAVLFLFGATLLPVCVFLIHYVGLAYSPFAAIGWASVLADFGGLLVIVACAGELLGLWQHLRGRTMQGQESEPSLLSERTWSSRVLLAGGAWLVLLGFLHGAYYAGAHLYANEARDPALLGAIMTSAASGNLSAATAAVADYGALQAEHAVHIAAHAHVIEFGVLALLLAFIQPFVFLSERWKRRWVVLLLLGSLALPVFVLLELRWGLIAGGLADLGGLLVVVALLGMLAGVFRYTGARDARESQA